MLDLPVFLVSTAALLPDAWTLRQAITVNDACYVVLARHLRATLVTGDLRLARAPQLDVPTLVPPAS
jgi:predicted nucleic acid-binding protein